EIHECGDAIRIPCADRAQLLTRDRMPDEDRAIQLERIQYSEYIVAERVTARRKRRKARFAETAARNAIDVEIVGELRREVVEDMCRVAAAGQQHQRPSITAPIEDLQPHVLANCYELT